MIYFLILFYTIYLVFQYDINKRKKGLQFHYYALLILSICVAGFSYRLGMDSVGYMYYFEHSVDGDFLYTFRHIADYRYEPIPTLLFSLIKGLTNNYVVLQFVVAIFVNSTVFWFLRKHSPMLFFSILLFFIYQYWNFNFEIKRESIAISFFLIGINRILKDNVSSKDYIVYYVFATLAILSHRFAFATLLYPFFRNINSSKTTIYIFIALSIIVYSGIIPLGDLFTRLNMITGIMGVESSFTNYIEESAEQGGSTIFGYIEGVLIPAVILLRSEKYLSKQLYSYAIFYMFIMILQSQLFFFYRITNYFCFFLYIAYSGFLLKTIKDKHERPLIILLFFAVSLVLMGKFQKPNHIRYYPYSSIFTEETLPEREAEYTNLGWEYNE